MKPQPGSSDRSLTYFALVGFVASCGLLATDHSPFGTGIEPEKDVGVVVRTLGSVQRRHQGSLVWRTVRDGARLFEGDSVFTGPGASGALRLDDGSVLEVDESSLVILEQVGRRNASSEVRLEEGRVRGESSTAELRMRVGETTARLGRNAAANVEKGRDRVEVFSDTGAVSVASASQPPRVLDPGTVMKMSGGSVEMERWTLRLTAPANGEFVRYRGTESPRVTLAWEGRDDAAAFVRLACGIDTPQRIALSSTSSSLAVTPPGAGMCRWRIVDTNGRERSEERRFAVVEDRPPMALRPVADELVVAPSGDALLAWSRINGTERYRVELSTDPSFEAPEIAREVERAEQLFVELPASELRWHWRVRGIHGDADAQWSPAETFRMTTFTGSEAPTRLDAEVRFDAAP